MNQIRHFQSHFTYSQRTWEGKDKNRWAYQFHSLTFPLTTKVASRSTIQKSKRLEKKLKSCSFLGREENADSILRLLGHNIYGLSAGRYYIQE